jgi:acetoin utilization deacetylase AcuC-like enzyme
VSYWCFLFSSVLLISLHRYEYGSFYPSLEDGSEEKVGEGDGEGYNVNIAWNYVGIILTVLMIAGVFVLVR